MYNLYLLINILYGVFTSFPHCIISTLWHLAEAKLCSRSTRTLCHSEDMYKSKNNNYPLLLRYNEMNSQHLAIFFLPVQRKSGMSEALYGQYDVISSSYGAERKLCLVEARPRHVAHMWHSQSTFSTKISTPRVRTIPSTPQNSPFRYVKRMPVVPYVLFLF